MSGPKCASYYVDPLALERQRRLAAARDHRDVLEQRRQPLELASAARAAQGLKPVQVPEVRDHPPGSSVQQMESWNATTEAAIARAEAELTTIEQRERQDDLRRKLAAIASGSATEEIHRRAEDDRARAESPSSPRDSSQPESSATLFDRDAEIAALVEMIPADASNEEREVIDGRLLALANASVVEFKSVVVAVKAEIQRTERSISRRAESARRAQGLVETLDGLQGSRVDASRDLLQRVIAGATPLLDSDVVEVTRAREEAMVDFEQRFVASRLEAAFRDCGFEVGAGFVSDVLSGDEAYFASRSSREHAVGVRMREGLVDLRVVRGEGSPHAAQDEGAEVEFCKDIGRVSAELHRNGVDLRLESHVRAGSAPMARVDEARAVLSDRSTPVRQDRARQRSRER